MGLTSARKPSAALWKSCMVERINIGVLGTSSFAQRAIIPAILHLNDRFDFAGIGSRLSDQSDVNTHIVGSYDDLIEDDKVNAVYIPLPNALHFEWVKKALNSGKHVLCEKSVGCTFDEVEQLVDLARRNKLVLLENFHFRLHPQMLFLKKALREIGDVRAIKSCFGFPPFSNQDNIRYSAALGGGALLDAGAYPIRFLIELFGPQLEVQASRLNYDDARGVDTWGSAFILAEDKIGCFSSFGFDNDYQCSVEIWGQGGTLSARRIFTAQPDFKASVQVSQGGKVSDHFFEPSNSYVDILLKFYELAMRFDDIEWNKELNENLLQAKLIAELRTKANLYTISPNSQL